MAIKIIKGDITKVKADAIVNAANESLLGGGGVDGAIHRAAGPGLVAECRMLNGCRVGEAKITKGYNLSAKFVIHTVGPVWQGGEHDEEMLLTYCFLNSLKLAKENGIETIAFPLISSGIYGYPKEEALAVATKVIGEWLMANDMNVSLVVFDKTAYALSNELLGGVKSYIGENYVDEREARNSRRQTFFEDETLHLKPDESLRSMSESAWQTPQMPQPDVAFEKEVKKKSFLPATSLQKFVGRLDEPFSAALLHLIDEKGKTDVEIYKRANIDRKLFSKIRTGKGYMPSKKTAVALAVALELSLDETRDLLGRAGFMLSRSVMFDVIIEYFITRKKYDIFEINNVLFEYDQSLLGG